MNRNIAGFNQWRGPAQPAWPPHEVAIYNRVGAQNRQREQRLSEEQAARYVKMRDYWLERGAYYRDTTNYPDDLCSVLAARDVLNVITSER